MMQPGLSNVWNSSAEGFRTTALYLKNLSKYKSSKSMKKVIISILAILALFACATIDESQISNGRQGERLSVMPGVLTKSMNMSQADSLKRVYQYQSNKKRMLLYQIEEHNGVYVLNLSKAEAAELNIADSLFTWAQEIVDELNK